MQNILSRIVKYNIYVLAFLVPLFWLPFSFEVFEFNKQYLLFFLVSLALLAWLARMAIYEKELKFRTSPLDMFVWGFLGLGVLSAIFSVDRSSSLYGFYGRFSNGLIGLLSLGGLYFLITNNVSVDDGEKPKLQNPNSKQIQSSKLLKLFLWSGSLVVLAGYFSVFGVWERISKLLPLPQLITQKTFNPVSGSLEGLAIFLAVIIVLLAGKILAGEERVRSKMLLLLAALGLMVVIDYSMAWAVLLAALLLVVGFGMWKRLFKENVNRLLLPIVLIIIAGAMIPLQPVKMGLPQERVLPQQISWGVGFQSATDSVKNGFLGSGIGTFHYDFARYKALDINQTWFWQIRFDRAGSHIAEVLGTMGFLGILAWLSVAGIFLLVSYFLMGDKNVLPLLMAFTALLASQFVYYQNSALAFMFWLILGLGVVAWQKPIKERHIALEKFPELSLVFSTLTIVAGVAIAALYFYGARFYLADASYSRAVSKLGQERVNGLEKAVVLNPGSAQYRAALGRAYLNQIFQEQDAAKIQLYVSRAIDQARAATILSPNGVANWETLAVVYREIRQIAAGSIDWGVKSFEEAALLEPTNPVLYTELGKLYLAGGNSQRAKESFEKAISKKPDYSDAIIQQALLLEQESIVDEAISKLEGLVSANPFHLEASFQLGRLYFNNGRADEAIEQFRKVVTLVPGHSNAHYALGVAYASKKNKTAAIEEFQKVLELNPGNQDIIQKIEQLKGK